ncbi:MmcQ/YjbR family DNA-binding protein [Paenibacillus sp. YPG26]|uniref:MmcQ/YjbR family DNA-binding protein n=1 Tax=Paenibacillus sp. YPG26 TaxID=2878915 RepID=UPI00203C10AA|nr:MmcQ/YjbR family DNA-binding protein [Paenibacillus sp. YPG26]USB33363.1 MmcQ/YjbR family DNA-binding protein [Paenibacillus sp. YPG26]
MKHQELIELGLGYPGTRLDYPFDPSLPVLYVGSKMFALLTNHLDVPSVNLKTNPEEAWIQRESYPGAVIPGYHMNKRHWNTVLLNGQVPDEVIAAMLQESYQLVVAKMPKASRLLLFQSENPPAE